MCDRGPIDPSAAGQGDQLLTASFHDRSLDEVPDHLRDNAQALSLILQPVIGPGDPRLAAYRLLQAFGSLGAVLRAGVERLTEHIDKHVACHIHATHLAFKRVLREEIEDRPLIGSSSDLKTYLRTSFPHAKTEQISALFLDKMNHLIADEVLTSGTIDHVVVCPGEVVVRAIQLAASALILVHVRPNGEAIPSRSDVRLGREVMAAVTALGIAMHDHVIVVTEDVVSLRSRRTM